MDPSLEKSLSGPIAGETRCAGCGAAFVCGGRAGSTCWCAELPPSLPVPDVSAGCYCRRCLEALIARGARG